MRNRILGIAGLMLRQAVRSRFVLCLLVLMVSLLLCFALTIKGDGTAAGRLQMLLSYALSTVGVVLGVAILWLSCGSFAVEIENRRLHLVLVKPVRYVEVWVGKWLGIVTVAMLLLVVAGSFLELAGWVALRRATSESADGRAVRERILVARQQAEMTRIPGAPGEARWEVTCPAVVSPAPAMATLVYRFVSPLRDLPPVEVHWQVVGADGAIRYEANHTAYMDGVNRLEIAVDRLTPGAAQTFVFKIVAGDGDVPQHVTFHPDTPVELLVPVGGFEGNLVRALLLMFCRVALVAALGVTLSTVFTFPVAAFAAAGLVVATLFVQFFAFSSAPERHVGHDHGAPPAPPWSEWVGDHLARGLEVVVAPVLHYRVRGRLAEGVTVPWAEVYEAAGVLVFGYGGVLCVLACATLRRREIALPV